MSSSDAKAICDRLNAHLPHVKSGTLRLWDVWFGRPWDNVHHIARCEADGEVLRVWFDLGETLTVQSPVGFEVTTDAFWIRNAQQVRWEWFGYGAAQTPENSFVMEFTRVNDDINGTLNGRADRSMRPWAGANAVELL